MFPRQGERKNYQIDFPVNIMLKICFLPFFSDFLSSAFSYVLWFYHPSVGENVAEGKVEIQKFVINMVCFLLTKL